ncbi:MAG: L,D-transpeptidase, partial [Chthoniobacteraceae bacterium]
IGHGAEPGAVFHGCRQTGEICPPNAPGRDPIVTRILRLRGLEAQNAHALSRGIYIHGTPDERHIGRPASYGCIRMKSRDVLELFEQVRPGTRVEITTDRVGGLFGNASRPVADRS